MNFIKIHSQRLASSGLFFVNGFVNASWIPHIPFIQERFALDESQLGFTLLFLALGATLAMPLTGKLIGQVGSKVIIVISSLALCLFLPTLLWTDSFYLQLGMMSLFGVFNGAMDVSMNAHGLKVEQVLKLKMFSSLHALFSSGGLLGAALTGALLSVEIAPLHHVISVSCLMIVISLFSFPYLLPAATDQEAKENTNYRKGLNLSLPPKSIVLLAALAYIIMMTEVAMADWSAIFIADLEGASPALAAYGFAAFSLSMAFCRFSGDWILAKFNESAVLNTGILLSGLGMGFSVISDTPTGAIISFALIGLGLANVIPVLFKRASKIKAISPGTGIATVTTLGYAGFLCGPPLIGFMSDYTSLRITFALLGITLMVISSYLIIRAKFRFA